MNMTTESIGGVAIVRVSETRLMYPLLSEFADTVTALIKSGERKVLIDLAPVVYVDSASIGCLMDLYRQAHAAGATLKLSGVQKRVTTMLTMTGAQQFIDVHGDEQAALETFGE
jgi:anti-anti-sigma factor